MEDMILDKKSLEDNTQGLAEIATRATIAQKPHTLKQFEKKAQKVVAKMGLVTKEQRDEILTRMQKTQIFRQLADNFISDEELITKLKEGLDATKVISTKSETLTVPDYATRHQYITTTMKAKGIDAQADDDSSNNMVTQINIIAPDS